jgi:glycosyltransferase involved in cell wall biosynthesis
MNLLFIHQNFPGQYKHIIDALQGAQGHNIVGLGIETPDPEEIRSCTYYKYNINRGNSRTTHPWGADFETKLIRGEACANSLDQLKRKGFVPDLICCHPAWGEMLFAKDIFPNTPILAYQEFFYNSSNFDFDFDTEFQSHRNWTDNAKLRAKRANQLMSLEDATWNVTPTAFQKSSFPIQNLSQISIIHDGINTRLAAPATKPLTVSIEKTGRKDIFSSNDLIITFINRTFEPYRGCHTFTRAIPLIQEQLPNAQILIIGSTYGVSYGSSCPEGEWKDFFFKEIENKYDKSKVHFLGQLAHSQMISILQLSSAHVYLTYPFVLSWSLLEAMSCGCPVVGSATEPVMEVIQNGQNGLLVDFFKPADLASAIVDLARNRDNAKMLGEAARQTILQKYSLEICVPRQLALMDLVASGALSRDRV